MKKIYLDYAATTPIDPDVLKAMMPYLTYPPADGFGNPSSLHFFGQEALAAVDEAREKIAKAIGTDFREIIFTGSATESNNLVFRGITQKYTRECAKIFCVNPRKISKIPRPRIIVSVIEHPSIMETAKNLENEWVEIIYLPVDRHGFVDLKKLKNSLNEQTILVSIMYANNETGTIQPITEIANIIRNFKNSKFKTRDLKQIQNPKLKIQNNKVSDLPAVYPLFHTDAVQAFQFLDCDVNKLGVDLMTLSAHKIYGPKGIGLLYSRALYPKLNTLTPIITGGGQEFGLRSGTENVPAIVGFAKAVELAVKNREKETSRLANLSNYFWNKLKKICLKAELNGNKTTNCQLSITNLPNILNIYFPNQSAEELLIKLDLNGVAASTGSACSARAIKLSHILKALDLPDKKIKGSLRFSFGKFTTKEEINQALKIIKKVL